MCGGRCLQRSGNYVCSGRILRAQNQSGFPIIMLRPSIRILTKSSRILYCSHRHFTVDALLTGAVAAASSGIATFLFNRRRIDSLRTELELNRNRAREFETRIAKTAEVEENLQTTKEELSKKIFEIMEQRASCEKLDALLTLENETRLKKEADLVQAVEKIKGLEANLSNLNLKYIEESRLLSQFKGRLESAQAAGQMAKEQADRERDARTSLEKTIETSLKINIERVREELVSRTRDVVGPAVVETLKSTLRQTPVLGRFGEIQLEYLLREYFTLGELKLYDQQITLDSKKRLDAVLKLPVENGVLHIIVEAKSPNIFQSDENAGDFQVGVTQLRARLVEVLTALTKANYVEHYRQHLASRNNKPNSTNSNQHVCDFVLMFLPMDFALLAIDEKLLKKCLEAKVIVCTPSLLGLQIEFIKMAWRHKLPSDAVQHVEEDFTVLTDSLVSLTKDLEKCGSSLRVATTKAEKATNRLKNSVAGVFAKTVGAH